MLFSLVDLRVTEFNNDGQEPENKETRTNTIQLRIVRASKLCDKYAFL